MQTFCNKLSERSSPVSPTMFAKIDEKKAPEVPFENENEGRPRSPVHETSIIVPKIDWSQQQQQKRDSSESSSDSSSESDFELEIAKSSSVKSFSAIPKLEVQDVDVPEDSLNYEVNYKSEPPKSICGERKVLNQPKKLPVLIGGDTLLNQVHAVLHNKGNKGENVLNKRQEDHALKQKDSVETQGKIEAEVKGLEGAEAIRSEGKNMGSRIELEGELSKSELRKDTEFEGIGSRGISRTELPKGELKKDTESERSGSRGISRTELSKGELKKGAESEVIGSRGTSRTKLERPTGELPKSEIKKDIASEIEPQFKTSEYPGKTIPKTPPAIQSKYSGSNNKFKITNTRGNAQEPKLAEQLSPFKSKLKQETDRARLEDDKSGSGRSTPSNNDPITAVLTETELSDWAREGAVSDDLDDEFEPKLRHHKKPKTVRTKSKSEARKAVIVEIDELNKHVCGKSRPKSEPLTECVNSVLHPDLDNIEFMDTGSESSEDEIVEVKNNGYIQFHDEDDIIEDSLSPVINVVEAKNPRIKATFDEDFDDLSISKNTDLSPKPPIYNELSTVSKNTGYCIIGNENENFGGEVIDLKPTDLERLREKRNQAENEEDSLLIIETGGTTTEENTCSDSTVKNITQIPPCKPETSENNNTFNTKRLEDKLAQVKKDMKKLQEQRKAELTTKQIAEQNMRNNIEFEQHCQRLQSRVDFGNARDSIDIRKSRRQSKGSASPTQPKPDLIQEEKEPSPLQTRREQIEKERDVNKKLVQEMVMNKMKAQNKSLERKRRSRNSFSPARPGELTKSTTSDNMLQHLTNPTPDVLLNIIPVQKSQTVAALSDFNKPVVGGEPKAVPRAKYLNRPLSVHSAFLGERGCEAGVKKLEGGNEAFSLPDIQKALVMDQFQTPKVPPRLRSEEARRGMEKLKEDARARAKLLSDEDLGLSPEDKLARLRQRVNRRGKENDSDIHVQDSIESLVMNTERRNSLLYSNDTLKKKKNNSFRRSKSGEEYLNRANATQNERERTKSVSDLNKQVALCRKENIDDANKTSCFNKSDPNLLDVEVIRREKKKPKDRERRKSITKMFTDLFSKKKDAIVVTPSNGNKGFLARISPKARDKSKEVIKEEQLQRRMSFTELRRSVPGNVSPPPIPPLPLNYTGSKSIEDSSDGESDYKRIDRSSCDTLDQSGIQDGSISSRKSGRSKRAARQSQLKRHRMAQEIQRKLEETEVKMRELELRGVRVEKALRGECDGEESKEETDLLKEWFDLMRDMTELKRYERELNVRAQELELEDRHARLQHDLKERLEIDGQKSREDIETEGSIIKEMMDIVRKRDSLIALLEEDRQRYTEEDRGFEEQMLAKGLNLTPILAAKVSEK